MKAKYMDMAAEALIFTVVTTGVRVVEGTVAYVVATDLPGRTVEKIKTDHQKRVERITEKKEERKAKREEKKNQKKEKNTKEK